MSKENIELCNIDELLKTNDKKATSYFSSKKVYNNDSFMKEDCIPP